MSGIRFTLSDTTRAVRGVFAGQIVEALMGTLLWGLFIVLGCHVSYPSGLT